MISTEVVAEIRRLLEEDRLSQRQIARLMGVCRGTVGAIALGRRPDPAPRVEEDPLEPAGPPERCPGCGAKVYMPCVYCRVQSEMSKRRGLPANARRHRGVPSTDLELRPDHRVRYEEVREARRLAEGE
ncbi:MAG: helix-turn-helix transcriptional regulator [Thermoguttaceae bacterium]